MAERLSFDEAAARRVEAVYLSPDIVATRLAVLRALDLRRGENVVDIGCGPGLLTWDLARTVGDGGRVVGLDNSDAMLDLAKRRLGPFPWVELREADAHELPARDGTFDAAVVVQVLEYLSDVDRALRELFRVLRPGGRLVLLDTEWDTLVLHSEHPERMARVLAAWEDHCADPRLPRTLAPRLRAAGFDLGARELVPVYDPEWHANTYAQGIVPLIAGFVAGRPEIGPQLATAWEAELMGLAARGAFFLSLNRYLFVARRP
jgi:ubiquinone/menaquinone biosynthesis C-methylase UbiE